MPAVDMLHTAQNECVSRVHCDIRLLFAASGDIRNVIKSIAEGLPNRYNGQYSLVINNINFIVVARNAILLLVALSLETDDAVMTIIHVWYLALLPRVVIDTLRHAALGRIVDVYKKMKNKPSTSF